jgi:TonB-linked SusC/RagA family outer membrane protein
MTKILQNLSGKLSCFVCFLAAALMLAPASAKGQQNNKALAKVERVSPASEIFYKSSLNLQIDLQMSDLALEQALRQVSEKAGLKLTYRGDILSDKKVSMSRNQISVTDALDFILEGESLDYAFSKPRYLIVHPKEELKEAGVAAEVADPVTGVITDAQSGEVVPGVNIIVKGTTTGTFTNEAGEYTITPPSQNDTLVVSFISYQNQEVPIDGRTEINISLTPATFTAEEMVVVGYGEQRKISLIGSQSSIDDVDELSTSTGSLTNSLAGRLSGVVGVQRTGLPGSDASDIWIRGISTFGDSGPLILVDGIERPMNTLNPNDIASLSILKDASATAVYGTRGANGVILVETKEGKEGKPTINVEYNQGITELTQIPDLADGPTYMRLANEASMTRGGNPIFTEEAIQNTVDQTNPLIYPDVNWMETVFNDFGQNREFNTNVNGGSESTQYYVSLGYYNEKGLLINNETTNYNTNSNYSKYNLQSNVTLDVTPTTQAKLGVGGYLEDTQYPAVGVGGIFNQAMQASPVAYPVIYPGGLAPGRNPNGGERNPYIDATSRGYSDEFNSQLFSNLEIIQELEMIVEGLSLKGLFGYDTNSSNTVRRERRPSTFYIDPSSPFGVDGRYDYNETFAGNNALNFGNTNTGGRKYYLEGSLNYRNDFGSNHQVSGLLLYSQTDEQVSDFATLTGSIPFRQQSIALRGTYSYDDRYFFEANFGYSGSEDFAEENRYGFFPSAGVGWVISNENFFEPLSGAIDFLKIRYSDGFVGADDTGGRRFAYLTLLNGGAAGYGYGINGGAGRGGISVTDYGVSVQWAESRKQDLGIELRTFNDKLSFTIDFFKDRRDGIFLTRGSIPNFVGLTSDPVGNLGVIENRGFDGQIQFNGNIGNDFSFGLQGQFTYNVDEIIENDQPPQPHPWLDRRGNNILAIYGYEAEGLFESQEEIDNHASQFGQVLPGDIKYRDLNDDGVINAFDRTKIARGDVPSLTLGTGITFGYKSFDLQAFFQAQYGAEDQIGGFGIQPFSGGGGRGNIYAVATNRWTEENPDIDARYPRLAYGQAENNNNYQTSSFWTRDLDFIRMKEMEVGYTLPLSIVGETTINSARIYFRGRNLLTFTDFDLWDPELNTGNGAAYPNTRVFSLGLDIQF